LNNLLKNPELTDFQRQWYRTIRENYASYFAFPLVVRNQLFGGLVFYFKSHHDFDEEDLQLGSMLGEQAALAIENNRLHQVEQDRQRELQILLDVAETANSSLDLDEIVTETLDLLVALISASRAGVILLDDDTGQLGSYTLRPTREIDPDDLARIIQASQDVIKSGETLYIAPDFAANLREPGALLPLQTRGRILGVLGIIGSEMSAFSAEQLALFKSIADQLSVAIENAHLFEKAEYAAIAAERNRLARDLHDAVTQTLFSASLIAEALPELWRSDQKEGEGLLTELRQLNRGALAEMRTLLHELRPTTISETSLDELLRQLGESVTGKEGIPVHIQVDCHCELPSDVHLALYRITQEALNNIVKHARASQVSLRLDCSKCRNDGASSTISRKITLVIKDDGRGFDVEQISLQGMGLGIMRERAESVGAVFQITSQPGNGTQIKVIWDDTERM